MKEKSLQINKSFQHTKRKYFFTLFCNLILCYNSLSTHAAKPFKQISGTKEVNFNHNWQTASVGVAKDPYGGRQLISQQEWQILERSFTGGKSDPVHPIGAAFDNNVGTYWENTVWDADHPLPYSIVIDLGKETKASAFVFINGHRFMAERSPKSIQIYMGNSPNNWGAPTAKTDLTTSSDAQIVNFEKPSSGRYLKLIITSTQKNNTTLAIGELGLLGVDEKRQGADFNDQWRVTHENNKGSDLIPMSDSDKEHVLRILSQGTKTVSLPHTGKIEPREVSDPWEGITVYRKTFNAEQSWKGKRVIIEFGAAMQIGDFWINGKHIHQQAGGYMSFTLDLTKYLKYNAENELLVHLDNRPHPNVPPGRPVKQLDFEYFPGLYRTAVLRIQNPVHITNALDSKQVAGGGIFIQYQDVSEKSAKVIIKTEIRNDQNENVQAVIKQTIETLSGRTVATGKMSLPINKQQDASGEMVLTVNKPSLWSTDKPNLYKLRTTITVGKKQTDVKETRFGIRTISASIHKGLLLNGKPLWLRGSNRHQEYPWLGNALSASANWRDAWLIKNAGLNYIRLCHYPQDPSFYDACDELGILVGDAIPGWQYYNSNPAFQERVERDVRQMIRRDRNHPCVALWEVSLNESYPPAAFRRRLVEVAHEEFPGCLTTGDSYGLNTKDSSNYDVPHCDGHNFGDDIIRPQTVQKNSPSYIREYGDYEFGGGYSTSRVRRADGEQAMLRATWNVYWHHNKNRSQWPWTVGDATWVMFDHNRGVNPGVSPCGMADIVRIPKFTYYFFQSQRDPTLPSIGYNLEAGPMVYIPTYWTKQNKKEAQKIVVFGNTEEVSLILNGKEIERRKPDNGKANKHTQFGGKNNTAWDGQNANQIAHPAFTFNNVTYQAGALEAIGWINGKKVAKYVVKTPGEPYKLSLSADYCNKQLVADGADAIFIRATIQDSHGITCWTSQAPLRFTVQGDATIVSPDQLPAEAGIGSILLQAGRTTKPIIISVSSDGLLPATLTVKPIKEEN